MPHPNIKNWLFELYQLFDSGQIEELLQSIADDAEWFTLGDPSDSPVSGSFEGKDQIVYYFQQVKDTLEHMTNGPASIEDIYVDGDRAFVLGRATGRGVRTGRILNTMFVDVVWIKRENDAFKITKYKRYIDTLKSYRALVG